MELTTASAVMKYAEKLETDSARFYETAAARFTDLRNPLMGFIKENDKNVKAIKRAYYSVISDALEACFSFGCLSTEPYALELDEGAGPDDILRTCINNETLIQGFYQEAARFSEPFMADVPAAFKRMARNRDKRKTELQELLDAKLGS
jgi:hypothetical protein